MSRSPGRLLRNPCDPKDGTYHERIVLKPADTVSPLAFPDLEIAVSDLLP